MKGLTLFRSFVTHLLACISSNARTPWQFNCSTTWPIEKHNGKVGTDALRLVHGIPILGKCVLSVLYDEAEADIHMPTPHNVYHVRRRRREEAVAIQLMNSNRLTMAGVSHMRNFRDAFNAYPSILHEAALTTLDSVNNPAIHDPITDHVQQNLFSITTPEDTRFFRADCGVMAGSTLWDKFVQPGRLACAEGLV